MNIGLISGEFPPMPGGVGDFTRLLAENLRGALGHDVHVLSRAGAVHEQLPVSTISGWGAGCLLQIRRWARRFALDIVNLQYQTAAFNMSPYHSFLARYSLACRSLPHFTICAIPTSSPKRVRCVIGS